MQRRRPGAYAEGQVYNIYFNEVAVRPSRAQDAVRAVFSKGGACYDCHTIFAPQAGKGWRVAAVAQPPRYLQKGWFDHAAHTATDCADVQPPSPAPTAPAAIHAPGPPQHPNTH